MIISVNWVLLDTLFTLCYNYNAFKGDIEMEEIQNRSRLVFLKNQIRNFKFSRNYFILATASWILATVLNGYRMIENPSSTRKFIFSLKVITVLLSGLNCSLRQGTINKLNRECEDLEAKENSKALIK